MQEAGMTPHADDMAHPGWRLLAASARQAWLAPLIVGVAWWNAALDVWLDISRAPRRHGETHDRPPALDPLEPDPAIALLA
jgi:hypothetical protein